MKSSAVNDRNKSCATRKKAASCHVRTVKERYLSRYKSCTSVKAASNSNYRTRISKHWGKHFERWHKPCNTLSSHAAAFFHHRTLTHPKHLKRKPIHLHRLAHPRLTPVHSQFRMATPGPDAPPETKSLATSLLREGFHAASRILIQHDQRRRLPHIRLTLSWWLARTELKSFWAHLSRLPSRLVVWPRKISGPFRAHLSRLASRLMMQLGRVHRCLRCPLTLCSLLPAPDTQPKSRRSSPSSTRRL